MCQKVAQILCDGSYVYEESEWVNSGGMEGKITPSIETPKPQKPE